MRYVILITLVTALTCTGCEIVDHTPAWCMGPAEPSLLSSEGTQTVGGLNLYEGKASALRNGHVWPADTLFSKLYAYSTPDFNTMEISIELQSEAGFIHERISLRSVPKRLGLHPIDLPPPIYDEPQWIFAAYHDMYAPGTIYRLDETQSHHVSLTSYNASDCTIEGSLTLTAVRDSDFPKDAVLPDTLHFTHGKFSTHLVTWPYFGEGQPSLHQPQ